MFTGLNIRVLTLALSVALHLGAAIWLAATQSDQSLKPRKQTRTLKIKVTKTVKVSQKAQVQDQALAQRKVEKRKPAKAMAKKAIARKAIAQRAIAQKAKAQKAKPRQAKVPAKNKGVAIKGFSKAEPKAGQSAGQIAGQSAGQSAGPSGYVSLLPSAALDSQNTVQSYGSLQEERHRERQLESSGREMSSVAVRLAQIFESHITIPTVVRKHLGFNKATVRLINDPVGKGLYLRNLRGQPILRALLFEFLRQLPKLQSWRDLSARAFSVELELRTELGKQAKVVTTVNQGVISRLETTRQANALAKVFTVQESKEGKVLAGVNILGILDSLLSDGDKKTLQRAEAGFKNSPAYSGEIKFYVLR